jgi:[methyl-Co(III) methanol-specific corrinoid protein]:coenzyme M methyltransferase
MAGTQNFLLQIGLAEKAKVIRMMRQLMPVTIAYANAQFQAGADVVCLADHVTGDLASPRHYEELLLPIHKEITAQIGGPLILHVCGDCNDRMVLFAEAGFDAYHFEWQMDAKKAVEKVGHRMSLVGCINNAKTLYQGTPDDAYKQARYAIEAGVHIIGPECAIPLATPLENLQAIVSAVREGYESS